MAFQRGIAAVSYAFGIGVLHAVAGLVPNQLVVRIAAIAGWAFFWVRVKGKQALAFTSIQHHELRAIGEALHKRMVKLLGANQLMQQGHHECAIGARLDWNPFVGNRRIAGANRVDRDEASTAALEFGEGYFERVAVMVLRRADHHKQLGAI